MSKKLIDSARKAILEVFDHFIQMDDTKKFIKMFEKLKMGGTLQMASLLHTFNHLCIENIQKSMAEETIFIPLEKRENV